MHLISSWWYGVNLMLVKQHQTNSIRTGTLTHNPRRTLVLLGPVSVRWSQSHSRRGCGAHGGSSVTPHTEPHSSPSLYCSPDLLPGCYTLSEPCSYSPYRTWEWYCRKRQPIKNIFLSLSQLREICWGHNHNFSPVFAQVRLQSLQQRVAVNQNHFITTLLWHQLPHVHPAASADP